MMDMERPQEEEPPPETMPPEFDMTPPADRILQLLGLI